jgi:hypothetical protein
MPINMLEVERPVRAVAQDIHALLAPVYMLPEGDALKLYAQLSPRLQWLARRGASGQRRASLIVHHALTSAQCR